jgi:cytochrome c553
MSKAWKWLWGVIVVLVAVQWVRPARVNPAVDASLTVAHRLSPDARVTSVLQRSCNDCHSNETVWPWYSQIAPVSWMIAADVRDGRKQLNFSEWGKYPPGRQAELLRDICEEMRKRSMPERGYLLLHPEARLSDSDISEVCAWTQAATTTAAPSAD